MSDPGVHSASGSKQPSDKQLKSLGTRSEKKANTPPQSDVVASSTPKMQNPIIPVHESTPVGQSNCGLCNKPDDERMVQCDDCDVWHHFSCVDVSQDIKDRSWVCLKCVNAKATNGGSKSKRKSNVQKRSFTMLHKKAVRAINAKGKRKLTTTINRKGHVDDTKAKRDDNPMEAGGSHTKPAAMNPVGKAGSVVSEASFRSTKARLDVELKQIEAEETLMQEEMQRKRELVQKKFKVMKEIADLECCGGSVVDHQSVRHKVQDWLKRDETRNDEKCVTIQKATLVDPTKEVETENLRKSILLNCSKNKNPQEEEAVSETECENSEEEVQADDHGDSAYCEHERPLEKHVTTSMSGNSKLSVTEQHHSLRNQKRLTKDELAARQVVPRELPKFSGNPEEWPMFLSTYEDTTEICGYTEAENMIRLRNCLRGDAYNAVRSFLLRPETVGKAINALKLRFGRPELIIERLKEKIISMPNIRPDAMDKLVDFALEVQNLCATIEVYDESLYMCDTTLLKEFVIKLPPQIRLDWARYIRKLSTVKLSTFGRWIYSLAEDVSVVFESQSRGNKQPEFRGARREKYVNTHAEFKSHERDTPQTTISSSSANLASGEGKPCPACKGDCKNLGKCKRFQELSYEARWATVRGFNFCRKCLRQHKGGCYSGICGKNGCTFKHQVLLHKDFTPPAGSSDGSRHETTNQKEERNICTHQSGLVPGSFRYLPVTLFGEGVQVQCYAFLDDGSELTLIDEELADELKLSGDIRPLCLKWTGGTHRNESDSRSVNVEICGRGGKRSSLHDARTVKQLQLPFQTLDIQHLRSKYGYLYGLPIDSYSNVRPRILIGLRHANLMLVRKSREGKVGEPIAVKTNLGWTVYGGRANENSVNTISHTYHICTCSEQNAINLNQMVKNYFSIDSLVVNQNQPQLSKNDERAMLLLESRTRFNGLRYETGLLWRSDKVRLPDNKEIAVRRWRCLEKRMEKDEELANIMKEKIREYESKNYIRKLSQVELAEKHERVWYLPIFPVYNVNKPGKIRIVWDAAAQVYGTSLNSALLTGPDQLASLVGILYQFREHQIGLCADIREMFHQVGIIPVDQQCQRFLWRDHAEQNEPNTYVMQVMTFGACCSPATAQFVKNINADRFKEEYPEAVNIIKQKHYVDDLVMSVETEQKAVELAEAVRLIHMQGGFEIRNFVSNSPLVLSIMNGEKSVEKDLNITAELSSQKILGM
ncbi:uncharacterized protein LOC129781732, partial [Toxorhynchites rutilus septentrionalis]|uniref:uncharacterized protein LOC129781732 n=1 Tax=Toxorhynchites rutilus septentrionalis TaxID=329112 RepID=UPI0024784FB0